MTSADHFRPFIRALEHDRQLVLEMGRLLDRAQAINIDFRVTARLRLQQQIQLLGATLNANIRCSTGSILGLGTTAGG